MNEQEIAAEKTKRLAEQWPKAHIHAGGYTDPNGERVVHLMPGDWDKLPFAYKHTDAYCTQEARNCPCGSTLVVMTEIHDLAEE